MLHSDDEISTLKTGDGLTIYKKLNFSKLSSIVCKVTILHETNSY